VLASFLQDLKIELADNWPAFTYIGLTLGFSICYLRRRSAEVRLVKEIGERIQDDIRTRFDGLETLIRQSSLQEIPSTSRDHEAYRTRPSHRS